MQLYLTPPVNHLNNVAENHNFGGWNSSLITYYGILAKTLYFCELDFFLCKMWILIIIPKL